MQQVLHTLKDEEIPIELQAKAKERCRLVSGVAEKDYNAELQEEQIIKWFFRVRWYPWLAAALHSSWPTDTDRLSAAAVLAVESLSYSSI